MNADLIVQVSNINLMVNTFSLSIVLIPIIIYLIYFFLFIKKYPPDTFMQTIFTSILIISLILLMLFTMHSDEKYYKIIAKTQNFLNIYENSPALSLFKIAQKTIIPENDTIEITQNDIKIAKEYGFIFDKNKKYPFIKKLCLNQKTKNTVKPHPHVKPNLIIFFGESLSAIKLGCYNSTYKNITPNIDSFAKESLVIKEYYNHVSPTVRGIIGQLCSTYPEYGYHIWKSFKLETPPACSLSRLLKNEGYNNTYFSASAPKITYLEEQLKSIGYNETYFSDKIGREFLNGEIGLLQSCDYSDHQMIRSLIKYMKNITTKDNPFFITVSNMETHVDMDITTDGIPYKDGDNPVLNTTHNFDNAFGKFWNYFKASSFYKNTIVVLTADHAHFPSIKFSETAGKNYQKLYCDKIAFIIYNPYSDNRGVLNAYTTSIDFAPTIAEILDLKNKQNSFIGHSIFEERKKYKSGIGIFRDRLFTIEKGKLKVHDLNNETLPNIKSLHKLIRYSQQIQNNNHLWYNYTEDT